MHTETYAGLDVSDKTTHIHIVDKEGQFVWRGVVPSDPEALRGCLTKQAPHLKEAVLETGPLSSFLFHGLKARGVAVICVCARHAKRVLAARVNKTDALDAEGLAALIRAAAQKNVALVHSGTGVTRDGRFSAQFKVNSAAAPIRLPVGKLDTRNNPVFGTAGARFGVWLWFFAVDDCITGIFWPFDGSSG